MQTFDKIRSYYDEEIPEALASVKHHPMMQPMMKFIYPDLSVEEWLQKLESIRSIEDFQVTITYDALKKILADSSDGFFTSGFEKLDPGCSYLFVSNHRDIILDTSLINVALHLHGLIKTASAIGDNLVRNPFLLTMAKVNRNFIVQRGLPPRELLLSSQLLSAYIRHLLTTDNRSVWIAQREGRTKDGNDLTNPGVLKMLAMASGADSPDHYFKKVKLVPVSVSYEYDPTDALKLPEVIAHLHSEVYVKGDQEDFHSIIKGITGQKKRIHMHAGTVYEGLTHNDDLNTNLQIKNIADWIDGEIQGHYHLWPTNYLAFDMRYQTNQYAQHYTVQDKAAFITRMKLQIDTSNTEYVNSFLDMYANPVINQAKNEVLKPAIPVN